MRARSKGLDLLPALEVLWLAAVFTLGAEGGAEGDCLPPAIENDLVGGREVEAMLAGSLAVRSGFHDERRYREIAQALFIGELEGNGGFVRSTHVAEGDEIHMGDAVFLDVEELALGERHPLA